MGAAPDSISFSNTTSAPVILDTDTSSREPVGSGQPACSPPAYVSLLSPLIDKSRLSAPFLSSPLPGIPTYT